MFVDWQLVLLSWSYLMVVFGDPGVVPPNWKSLPEQNTEMGDFMSLARPSSSSEELDTSASPPFCDYCQNGKPPRCHHCSICKFFPTSKIFIWLPSQLMIFSYWFQILTAFNRISCLYCCINLYWHSNPVWSIIFKAVFEDCWYGRLEQHFVWHVQFLFASLDHTSWFHLRFT